MRRAEADADPYHPDNFIEIVDNYFEKQTTYDGTVVHVPKTLKPGSSKGRPLRRGFFDCRVPMWIAFVKTWLRRNK